jgi:hypothetical protein
MIKKIQRHMFHKGITAKDLAFGLFALLPLLVFTTFLMIGLIGSLLQ